MKNNQPSSLSQAADLGWIVKTMLGFVFIFIAAFCGFVHAQQGHTFWEGVKALPQLPEFRLIAAVILLSYVVLGKIEEHLDSISPVLMIRTILPPWIMARFPGTSWAFGFFGSLASMILLVACASACTNFWPVTIMLVYFCAYPYYADSRYFGDFFDFKTSASEIDH